MNLEKSLKLIEIFLIPHDEEVKKECLKIIKKLSETEAKNKLAALMSSMKAIAKGGDDLHNPSIFLGALMGMFTANASEEEKFPKIGPALKLIKEISKSTENIKQDA